MNSILSTNSGSYTPVHQFRSFNSDSLCRSTNYTGSPFHCQMAYFDTLSMFHPSRCAHPGPLTPVHPFWSIHTKGPVPTHPSWGSDTNPPMMVLPFQSIYLYPNFWNRSRTDSDSESKSSMWTLLYYKEYVVK